MANDTVKKFIPSKFVSGTFDRQLAEHGSIKLAYLSCKFHGKWMNLGKFEKLTNYKPYEQRNAVKEVEKAIYQNIVEHDNVPTSGLRILPSMMCSIGYSLYDPYQTGAAYASVLISDPRGFTISVTTTDFFKLLAVTGGSLNNWELPGEYVYVWNTSSAKFMPMSVNDPKYMDALSESNSVEATAGKCLTDKQLKSGSVYTAHHLLKGDFMYLGKHDTYSAKCHALAICNKSYNHLDDYLEHDKSLLRSRWITELTTVNKHILLSMSDMQSSYGSQYAIRSSCNGVFTNISSTEYDITYGDVMKNINHSVIFNKIDLTSLDMKSMSYDMFNELVASSSYDYYGREKFGGIAQCHYNRAGYMLFKSADGHQFGVRTNFSSKSTVDCVELIKSRIASMYGERYKVGTSFGSNMTPKAAYDLIKPITMTMTFENGNACPDIAAYGLMLWADDLKN